MLQQLLVDEADLLLLFSETDLFLGRTTPRFDQVTKVEHVSFDTACRPQGCKEFLLEPDQSASLEKVNYFFGLPSFLCDPKPEEHYLLDLLLGLVALELSYLSPLLGVLT